MFRRKNSLAAIVIMALIGGCGGGTSNQDSTSVAAFVPGVYTTINNCDSMTNGTLIDDSDNMYQVCGTKLSVGKLSGTIASSATGNGSVKFTVFDSGTPASTVTVQLPSGPVTVPVPAGNPTVSTSDTFSGTLLISNNYVIHINFTDTPGQSGKVAFDSKWIGASPIGSIMGSYSTLSGNYILYLPEKLAVDPTETLSISTSGVISGTTSLGMVMGQISKFNSATGVHDVSITLTPPSGPSVAMAGVIGPFDVDMTGSSQNSNYAGLLLAVSGTGAGFYKIFHHLK
jgi:hypothetical protein